MRWSKRKGMHHGNLVENVGIGKQGNSGHVGPRLCAFALHGGAGNDRVRHPRRCARGHSNFGDHGLQAQAAGAVERHRGWHQRLVDGLDNQEGQATVEFAVVAAGFLAATVALMALWRVLGDGLLVEHALAVASHHIQSVAPVTITDIFLY